MRKTPLVSLKKNRDFKRVFANGKSAADSLFVVYAADNGLGYYRLGVSVSKKVGCAVVRNRVKRLVRENFRLIIGQARGMDLVVIARVPVSKVPNRDKFKIVNTSVTHLLKRHGIVV